MDRPLHIGKPEWLKTNIPAGSPVYKLKNNLRSRSLHTVCEEAKCPNIHECWNAASATIMILGDTCTRACRFCHVKTGNPGGYLNTNEPLEVAKTCQELKLNYVVITMVDRDDLTDGGADHINKVVKCIKSLNPGIKVELLCGDLSGNSEALTQVLEAKPEVFAHNIETVESLSPRVRDARAQYQRSLHVLKNAKDLAPYPLVTKSAIMLGLGETHDQVVKSLEDLRAHDVDIITLGQYMKPTKQHLSIKRWVPPSEFDEFGAIARQLGFLGVASAPLVRSSYRAYSFYHEAIKNKK